MRNDTARGDRTRQFAEADAAVEVTLRPEPDRLSTATKQLDDRPPLRGEDKPAVTPRKIGATSQNAIKVEQKKVRDQFRPRVRQVVLEFDEDEPVSAAGSSDSVVVRSSDSVTIDFDVEDDRNFTFGVTSGGLEDIRKAVHAILRASHSPTTASIDEAIDIANAIRPIGSGEHEQFHVGLNRWLIPVTFDDDPKDQAAEGTEANDWQPVSRVVATLDVRGRFFATDNDGDGRFDATLSLESDDELAEAAMKITPTGELSYDQTAFHISGNPANGEHVEKRRTYRFAGKLDLGIALRGAGFPVRFGLDVDCAAYDDPWANTIVMVVDFIRLRIDPVHG